LYENSAEAKALFDKADEILGFKVPNHVWRFRSKLKSKPT
jgi:hypothetical protein